MLFIGNRLVTVLLLFYALASRACEEPHAFGTGLRRDVRSAPRNSMFFEVKQCAGISFMSL